MKQVKICLSFWILSITTILGVQGQALTFAKPLDVSNGTVSGVSCVDSGDINGDGLIDIVVLEGGVHAEDRATLAWFEQNKSGEWNRHNFSIPTALDDFIGSARCGDVDNDGDIDLIFSNDGHSTGPIIVYLLENPGKKKVNDPWSFHLISSIDGFHANDMRLADMDADGKLDVIVRHKNPESVKIVFQNKIDEWQTVTAYTGQAGEGLAIEDINSDGSPDITMTGHWFRTPENPRTESYERFDIESGYKSINPATKEEVGDINNDGRLDVVLSPAEHFKKYGGENYDLAWYEGPENPEEVKEWRKHIVKSNYNKAHCAKLADFDNDGDLDILSAVAWDNREIRIFINDKGEFKNSVLVAEGKGIYSGSVVDIDGDGDFDIVGEDKYAQDAKPWIHRNMIKK